MEKCILPFSLEVLILMADSHCRIYNVITNFGVGLHPTYNGNILGLSSHNVTHSHNTTFSNNIHPTEFQILVPKGVMNAALRDFLWKERILMFTLLDRSDSSLQRKNKQTEETREDEEMIGKPRPTRRCSEDWRRGLICNSI